MIRFVLMLAAPILVSAHPDIETRINDLGKAIDQAPQAHQLYLMRGQLYANHGDEMRAKRDFESSLALNDNARVHIALGNLSLWKGNYQEARDFFARALRMDSRVAQAWLGQAKAAAKLGSNELVLLSYRNYFSLEANPQPGHFAAAVRSIAPHDRASAQQLLEEGLERLGPAPTLTGLALSLGFNQ